jgi:hypothetical protein
MVVLLCGQEPCIHGLGMCLAVNTVSLNVASILSEKRSAVQTVTHLHMLGSWRWCGVNLLSCTDHYPPQQATSPTVQEV